MNMNKLLIITFLISLMSFKLQAQFTPGESYFGVNNYIEYIAGDMPSSFVAPHAVPKECGSPRP